MMYNVDPHAMLELLMTRIHFQDLAWRFMGKTQFLVAYLQNLGDLEGLCTAILGG